MLAAERGLTPSPNPPTTPSTSPWAENCEKALKSIRTKNGKNAVKKTWQNMRKVWMWFEGFSTRPNGNCIYLVWSFRPETHEIHHHHHDHHCKFPLPTPQPPTPPPWPPGPSATPPTASRLPPTASCPHSFDTWPHLCPRHAPLQARWAALSVFYKLTTTTSMTRTRAKHKNYQKNQMNIFLVIFSCSDIQHTHRANTLRKTNRRQRQAVEVSI